jgi:hypothetical protein
VAEHSLGRDLGEYLGVTLRGRKGYAVMVRVPMDEVRLVGGIAGRTGDQALPMTGNAGEVLRIGVNFSGIVAWGREQQPQRGQNYLVVHAPLTHSVGWAGGKTALPQSCSASQGQLGVVS